MSFLTKGCFLLVLPFFPIFSHVWWHRHLSSFSSPLAEVAEAGASGEGNANVMI